MDGHFGNHGVFTLFWVVFHKALASPAALVGKPPGAAGDANLTQIAAGGQLR